MKPVGLGAKRVRTTAGFADTEGEEADEVDAEDSVMNGLERLEEKRNYTLRAMPIRRAFDDGMCAAKTAVAISPRAPAHSRQRMPLSSAT
jgi:hypothetical protein